MKKYRILLAHPNGYTSVEVPAERWYTETAGKVYVLAVKEEIVAQFPAVTVLGIIELAQ